MWAWDEAHLGCGDQPNVVQSRYHAGLLEAAVGLGDTNVMMTSLIYDIMTEIQAQEKT